MTNEVKTTKTYRTAKGNEVVINGTLSLEKEIWADGHSIIVPACEIKISVIAGAHGDQGGDVRRMSAAEKKAAPAGCNWMVGKLPLTDEQAEIVKSVRAELEQHPAYQEKLAAIDADLLATEEHERETRKVYQAMNR